MSTLISLDGISKGYHIADQDTEVLHGISIDIEPGDYVSIMGPSGSGKTTLMHILGCLDIASSGRYILDGQDVSGLGEGPLTQVRRSKIGFIFQNFNLLSTLSALDNVALPLLYQRLPLSQQHDLALKALTRVGLAERLRYRPNQLSGGQQQRVAIARAIVTRPPLLLADEPTGNLDSQTGIEVLKLFGELSKEGHTIVMITHDPSVAAWGRRIIEFKDGHVVADREVTHD